MQSSQSRAIVGQAQVKISMPVLDKKPSIRQNLGERETIRDSVGYCKSRRRRYTFPGLWLRRLSLTFCCNGLLRASVP